MAVVVFLLMFSVITWDLSNQSLPAGGIEEPQGVATDGNWMATIDNRSTGPVMIVHDLSDLNSNWELLNGSIDLDSPYTITGSHLAVANQSDLVLFNLTDITDDIQPVLIIPMQRPDDVLLTGAGTVQYIITLSNGNLSAFDTSGNSVPLGFSSGNVEIVRANGLELAMVLENSPTNIQFSRIGSSGSIIINDINASAPEEQDEILAQWDTPVDMENATITDFVFDDEFLAATVNVSATDRLVVYNRSNDQQWLASDAKYAVSDPSLKNGILAWSIRDHLDPTKPLDKYMDGEIQFVNLTNNHTQLLTSDALHQWDPHVLENHLVYFEEDADGEVSIHIHSWTPELTVYSNIILQIGILFGVMLVFLFVVQKQSELRQNRMMDEEE